MAKLFISFLFLVTLIFITPLKSEEKINKLKDLLEKGLITENEFKKAISLIDENKEETLDSVTIKKITGNEVTNSNKEILDRALMWGSLKLYLNDKNFSKYEQKQFISKFGLKKTNKILSLLKISNLETLDGKVKTAFIEASNLLKKDKDFLIQELTNIQIKAEGNKIKKKNFLIKLLNYLK